MPVEEYQENVAIESPGVPGRLLTSILSCGQETTDQPDLGRQENRLSEIGTEDSSGNVDPTKLVAVGIAHVSQLNRPHR